MEYVFLIFLIIIFFAIILFYTRLFSSKAKPLLKLLSLLPLVFIGIWIYLKLTNPAETTPIISPIEEFVQEKVQTVLPSDSKLEEIVQEELSNANGTYAVAVKNLETGEEYYYNADHTFTSASLYKLWYMAEVFRQIENGKLSMNQTLSRSAEELNEIFGIDDEYAEVKEGYVTYTVEEALEQMITVSHNYAAHLLGVTVGLSNVRDLLSDYNLTSSKLTTSPPQTTARDILAYFERLYKGELISKDASHEMLAILKRQTLNDRIPKYLPDQTEIAHKTGELYGFKHDAGIVYAPSGDYIIVLMSDTPSQETAAEVEAKISQAVYNYFSAN